MNYKIILFNEENKSVTAAISEEECGEFIKAMKEQKPYWLKGEKSAFSFPGFLYAHIEKIEEEKKEEPIKAEEIQE